MNHSATLKIGVLLFVYNRPDHTRRILRAMKSEGLNAFTVYMDAPSNDTDRHKQSEIKQIFRNATWADHSLIARDRHLGLAKSIGGGITESLETFDAVIILEDDCLPLPGFRSFMVEGLKKFDEEKRIMSLCGYTYPCISSNEVMEEAFLLERFCPWGWATWRNRWKYFRSDLKELASGLHKFPRSLSSIGRDLEAYCNSEIFLKGDAQVWSINWILAHFLNSRLCLYPRRSLIQNIGFDGTGVHSTRTGEFEIPSDPSVQAHRAHLWFRETQIGAPDYAIQEKVIRFLEKRSKMTMLLKK